MAAVQFYLFLAAAGALLDAIFFVLGLTEREADRLHAFPLLWAVFTCFLAAGSAALSLALADFIESALHAALFSSPLARYGAPLDPLVGRAFLLLFLAEVAAAGFFYPLGVKLAAPAPRAALAAAEVRAAAPIRRAAAWRGPGVVLGREGKLYVLVKRGRGRG